MKQVSTVKLRVVGEPAGNLRFEFLPGARFMTGVGPLFLGTGYSFYSRYPDGCYKHHA
jgi:hypothetical protein